MEFEICTKTLEKLSEKLTAKFPATTPGCSMVKIAPLDDAFLEVYQPQVSPVLEKVNHTGKKKRKGEKGRKRISKIEKPKDVGHFLVQNFDCVGPSRNVVKRDAGGKKGTTLKTTEMSKNDRSSGSRWVNISSQSKQN